MSNNIDYNFNLNGVNVRIQSGGFGFLSHVAFLVTYGETSVYVTVNVGDNDESLDFLPLTVEYIEKLYAGGIISSSPYIKREGKPTEKEILVARLIDHAIRSLFSLNFKQETQITVQVLSYDEVNDPVLAAMIGVGFALVYSGLPFLGPYGVTKLGYINNQFVLNPNLQQMNDSMLEMFVSSVDKGIVSIEAEVHNLSEDLLIDGLNKAVENNKYLIQIQNDFLGKYGRKSFDFDDKNDKLVNYRSLLSEVYSNYSEDIRNALYIPDKISRSNAIDHIKRELIDKYKSEIDSGLVSENDISLILEDVSKKVYRSTVLATQRRPDGRKIDEVRPLSMKVGVLPRVHGSALFTRGETQSLTIVTLGTDKDELLQQGLEGDISKRYFHHYNMPGYANGEIDKKFGYPNRRSIGHGSIGEKALKNLIPNENDFPYTIRVVSEILSSNGSTSMAAVCASSLALMDAGVPLQSPVAGVSIGLVWDDENTGDYVILTDIMGIEDFYGDMDFKIAGTANGITVIQLDNKKSGIPLNIIREAIFRSKEARLLILDEMNKCISIPRSSLSLYAPKVKILRIDPAKIGELIGPGGKVIKSIIDKTQAKISIEEDGTVKIYSQEQESVDLAYTLILPFVGDLKEGSKLIGEVTRIENYGVFIEVPYTNIKGLVHASNLLKDGVRVNLYDVVKIGDIINVVFLGKDDKGRNKFKALFDNK